MAASDYLERAKSYKGYHYSVLEPKTLEYLHTRTLEMFRQVKRIFECEGISYMICGGTLLGAVSTGRFVPWDDDLDICIYEEDYENAIACLTDNRKGLSDGVVLQCAATDSNYYLGWMKIRDQRSHVYPDASRFKENGVWIDLYKMVRAKSEEVSLLVAKEAIAYLERRFSAGGLTQEEYEARIRDGKLQEKLEEEKKAYSQTSNDRNVRIIWSASKVVLDEDWIEPLQTVSFEGMEVTTFGNAEAYLRQHYGEFYRELPPDELRRVGIRRVEW